MGAIPLTDAARLLFPVLLQLQQNPPQLEWWHVALAALGVLSSLASAYAVWVGAKAYRERKAADLAMEESRRKSLELEARLKEMEREGKDDSEVLAGLLAMAKSVESQSLAMTARAEAQDRERAEWRSLIDTQTMTTSAMTNEIRRYATTTEHMLALMQEEAKTLKRIDTRMGVMERKEGEREKTVKEFNATLKEIRDELRDLNIALTTADGTAIVEIRRQVTDALKDVNVKLDKLSRIEALLEHLEAQDADTAPPAVTIDANVTVTPPDPPADSKPDEDTKP